MRQLAAKIAPVCQMGDVICLHGDLGAGKTTFARFFIQALGNTELVPSPTFTLVQQYETSPPVFHFDLYRLTDPEEIIELGLDEAQATGISLIEWPERLGDFLPKDRLEISLSLGKTEEERHVEIKKEGQWQQRQLAL